MNNYQNRGVGHPKHEVDPSKLKVEAVRKNGQGNITEVKLSDGQIVGVEQAIQMAEQDLIEDVNTGMTRGDNSHKTLRSYPDGNPDNNLDSLPTF